MIVLPISQGGDNFICPFLLSSLLQKLQTSHYLPSFPPLPSLETPNLLLSTFLPSSPFSRDSKSPIVFQISSGGAANFACLPFPPLFLLFSPFPSSSFSFPTFGAKEVRWDEGRERKGEEGRGKEGGGRKKTHYFSLMLHHFISILIFLKIS